MNIDLGDPFSFLKSPKPTPIPRPRYQQQQPNTNMPSTSASTSIGSNSSNVCTGSASQRQIGLGNAKQSSASGSASSPPQPAPRKSEPTSDSESTGSKIKNLNIDTLTTEYVKNLNYDEMHELVRTMMKERRYNSIPMARRRHSSISRNGSGGVQTRTIYRKGPNTAPPVCRPSNKEQTCVRKFARLRRTVSFMRFLSWPVACLASAYIGHVQYYRNLVPYLVPVWATLETITELM